jgi:large subunit ribosomal protein L6
MSRIGKLPVLIPEGVTVDIQDKTVTVKGSKGVLSYTYLSGVEIKQDENSLVVSVTSLEHKNLRGLTRTLIDNMMQ